jgi:S-adenosylmethionine synthetase
MAQMKMVEAVTAGHPDKICDQIADGLLDEFLRRDPETRANIEVFGSHGMLAVGGTVVSNADFDCTAVVRKIYEDVVKHNDVEPFVNIGISKPETDAKLFSCGTAVVHGYATKETREFMPRPQVIVQELVRRMDDLRHSDPSFYFMKPHGKAQVLFEGKDVKSVILLFEHSEEVSNQEIQARCLSKIVEPIVGQISGVQVLINPYGKYNGGEFMHGSGLTGRKVSSDAYGGLIPHGVSSLSGKCPYSPDRAGAYMARMAAKSIVASGHASNVLVSVGYTHGKSEPIFLQVVSGDGKDLTELVKKNFDFKIESIVKRLNLARPIYRDTACYGHFGRIGMPWEEVEAIKE